MVDVISQRWTNQTSGRICQSVNLPRKMANNRRDAGRRMTGMEVDNKEDNSNVTTTTALTRIQEKETNPITTTNSGLKKVDLSYDIPLGQKTGIRESR